MRKIVVLSTDDNSDYFFYAPIVSWIWDRFGWEPHLFTTDMSVKELFPDRWDSKIHAIHMIPEIEGVRSGTRAQVVRHFAANELDRDAYIMVQDIDLLPLKDFWKPDFEKITIYGWDTTGYGFIPVHYTGMMGFKWYDMMDCTGDLKVDMEREMKANGRAYQKDWDQYWDTDWDILTKKVLKLRESHPEEFVFIDRGTIHLAKDATPVGRLDRYDFEATLKQENITDMHCSNHNPSSTEKWSFIKTMLERSYGALPTWLDFYVEKHHAKYGQGR